jgi:hypothetical protein
MLKEFYHTLDKHNTKESNFENLTVIKSDSLPKDRLNELMSMDVVFPYELTKSLLTMSYNQNDAQLTTNYYCIAPNISFDIYPIKANNYSTASFKSILA